MCVFVRVCANVERRICQVNVLGWLRLVGSLILQVSFAKQPYKRDYILQKRRKISRSLLIVATPHALHVSIGLSRSQECAPAPAPALSIIHLFFLCVKQKLKKIFCVAFSVSQLAFYFLQGKSSHKIDLNVTKMTTAKSENSQE